MSLDWSLYPNFRKEEFDCKHTGKNKIRPEFMEILQEIRLIYDAPMKVNSGYRDISHPDEVYKSNPGEHTYGVACDIGVHGVDAIKLIAVCHAVGIKRVGVAGKPGKRFIHIGIGDRQLDFPEALWSY